MIIDGAVRFFLPTQREVWWLPPLGLVFNEKASVNKSSFTRYSRPLVLRTLQPQLQAVVCRF